MSRTSQRYVASGSGYLRAIIYPFQAPRYFASGSEELLWQSGRRRAMRRLLTGDYGDVVD